MVVMHHMLNLPCDHLDDVAFRTLVGRPHESRGDGVVEWGLQQQGEVGGVHDEVGLTWA